MHYCIEMFRVAKMYCLCNSDKLFHCQWRVKESTLCGPPWFLSRRHFFVFNNSELQRIIGKSWNRIWYFGFGLAFWNNSGIVNYFGMPILSFVMQSSCSSKNKVCACSWLGFFTGYLDSFQDIFLNYNKWNKFWYDVIIVFPFEVIAPVVGCTRLSHYHAQVFLRLNRVLSFIRYVPSSFVRWENILDVQIIRVRVVKFVVYIYSITHLCACLSYWLACGYFNQRWVCYFVFLLVS